ncbi:MAG: hypothetical protein J6D23_00850 [Clostridia bacterium]|nr:hypothetical protein [Clostridia bacterium]
MKIEYIIEGDAYKKAIKSIVKKEQKGIKITTKNDKVSGVNNYVLCISCEKDNLNTAKILSEISSSITSEIENVGTKFYMLSDEPSSYFAKKLYPLVCEFETKLRKLIYIALFDLDEQANTVVLDKLRNNLKKSIGDIKEVPKTNFLEKATLGDLFFFLFDNSEFIYEAKSKTNTIVNDIEKYATKAELIERISQIEEKTIWNKLFAKNFPDFNLPLIYRKLFTLRNDTMHFHTITYDKFENAKKLFQKTNLELDKQISKGIVLESTPENVEIISNNKQYGLSKLSLLFKALYDLQPKIDYVGLSIINQLIKPLGNLPDMSSVYDALGGSISRFANTLSGYNDIVANLYSSPLIDFYKNLPNYNDMLLNGFGVNTTPLIEDDIENDDGENDDDEKEQKNTQE